MAGRLFVERNGAIMDMKWIADVCDIVWTAADDTHLGGFAYTYDAVGRIPARRHASARTASTAPTYAYDFVVQCILK